MEMNEAIYTVLHAQYKKDAKEAFKMVENAGYEVFKYDGKFTIKHPMTGKWVRVGDGYRRGCYIYNHGRSFCIDKHPCPIDFVALLNKKPNDDFYTVCRNDKSWEGKKYCLSQAKFWVYRYQRSIEEKRENINRLMNEMLRDQMKLQREMVKLNKLRKEYGLTTKENGGV